MRNLGIKCFSKRVGGGAYKVVLCWSPPGYHLRMSPPRTIICAVFVSQYVSGGWIDLISCVHGLPVVVVLMYVCVLARPGILLGRLVSPGSWIRILAS